MKNLKFQIISLVLLSAWSQVSGQDMLNINDLNYGKESVNTAYIADDSSTLEISTILATASATENFNRFHFLFHGNIGKHGLGFGVKVNTAFYQIFQTNTTEFMIAKRVQLGKQHTLSFGLNSGIVLNRLRTERINTYTDIADPIIQNELYNKVGFTTGFGLRYNWKNKLDFGASLPVIIQSNNGLAPIYNTHISYKQALGKLMSIEPSFMAYGTDYTAPSIEGSIRLEYKDLIWLRVAGRSTKNLAFGAGTKINFLMVGYTFNSIVGEGFNEVFNNLHAIQVSFMFLGGQALRKNIVD